MSTLAGRLARKTQTPGLIDRLRDVKEREDEVLETPLRTVDALVERVTDTE